MKKQLYGQYGLDRRKAPRTSQVNHLNLVFSNWSKLSIYRTDIELNGYDSLTKIGYHVYEELISDSTFLGLNPKKIPEKYILLPYKLKVGVVDSYSLFLGKYEPIYNNLIEYEIKNFRPKTAFPLKQMIYLTEDRFNELINIYKKTNLTGFFNLNLLQNDGNYHFADLEILRMKRLETSPNITRIIHIKNTNEFIVYYRVGKETIAISVKKINNKWIKIKELERTFAGLVC